MGKGFECSCPKCGKTMKEHFGCGLYHFSTRDKVYKEIREGRYGKALQDYLQKNPEGEIDCGMVALQCEACPEWDNRMSLAIVQEEKRIPYPHKCEKCGGDMIPYDINEFVKKAEDKEILCPQCKVPMEITARIHWD